MRTFINAWVLFTLVLFYFGPIRWEGQSDPLPAVVVLSCLGMFNLGASRKVAPSKRPYNFIPIPSDRRAAYTIMIVYLVLSMIYLSSITGKNPFLLSSYSLEFGRVVGFNPNTGLFVQISRQRVNRHSCPQQISRKNLLWFIDFKRFE